MRLICPNCGAQYEVADDVIPEGGRDVQCSNCGHTWFERPGASVAEEEGWDEEAPETPTAPTEAPEPEVTPEPDPDQITATSDEADEVSFADLEEEPDDHWEEDPWDEPEERGEGDLELSSSDASQTLETSSPETPEETPEDTDTTDDDKDELAEAETLAGVAAMTEASRRSLDPEVEDILREEAAREQAAREAERATGLESQPDLGLDEGPAPASDEERKEAEARRRMALMKGEPDPAMQDAARRDLLPDIDQINSTLRPEEASADGTVSATEAEVAEQARRSGFRRGFSLVLIIVAVLVAIYAYAGQIGSSVPALAGPLGNYVESVDQGRLWLDLRLQDVTQRINDGG